MMACTAIGMDGAYYNINADEMAAARHFQTDRLVLLCFRCARRASVLSFPAESRENGGVTQIRSYLGRDASQNSACSAALAGNSGDSYRGRQGTDCLLRVLFQNNRGN